MERNISSITNERGAAGPKIIVAVAIIAAVVYAGIQLVPIYWDHWNLEDEIKTQVRFLFVNVNRKREEYLEGFTEGKLKEIGAEYDKEKGVRIKLDNSKKKVKIEVWYSRRHKLPLYKNPIQFYIKVENTPID